MKVNLVSRKVQQSPPVPYLDWDINPGKGAKNPTFLVERTGGVAGRIPSSL